MVSNTIKALAAAALVGVFVTIFVLLQSGTSGGQNNAADTGKTMVGAELDRSQIETIVKEYIQKNPRLIGDALLELQRIEAEEEEKRARVAITSNFEKLAYSDYAYIAGNPKGDVTVVEFFDYNCGFCKRAFADMAKLIENDKNVRVVFKEFPIFGKQSEDAARAALASVEQGKYFEFHRRLLVDPGRANKAKSLSIARDLGLDVEKLQADMNSSFVNKALEEAQKLAFDLRIQGTPHYLIGTDVIQGAPEDLYDQLVGRIAQVRKEGCGLQRC